VFFFALFICNNVKWCYFTVTSCRHYTAIESGDEPRFNVVLVSKSFYTRHTKTFNISGSLKSQNTLFFSLFSYDINLSAKPIC